MINIILEISILFAIFSIPYIISIVCAVITVAIISLIKTKIMSNTLKIVIVMIALLFIFIVFINVYHAQPDDLYIKMQTINDNKSLIGLSKEQVIELLEEPSETHKYGKVYLYSAGSIFRKISIVNCNLWVKNCHYVFSVNFDEADKVESTLLKESEELMRGG